MKIFPIRKKKVAIYLYDVRNRHVGLGEFAYQLATHFAMRAKELKAKYGVSFTFIVPDNYVGAFGDDVDYIVMSKRSRLILRYFKRGYALCHHIHQMGRLKKMFGAKCNLLTIHDINFKYEKKGEKKLRHSLRFQKQLRRADRLSYISDFAKDDVNSEYPNALPYTVIYNGVTDLTQETADLGKFDLPKNYLFHISSLLPKKNVHLLVEMMQYLPEENLILAGNLHSTYVQTMKKRIAELNLNNVWFIGSVSNEEKAELYRQCRGFLFPSLCEGFGLPVVEAMNFGKPVFLSTLTSLPEIGGDNAYYYEDLNPERMAAVTRDGLTAFYADEATSCAKTRAWASKFTWDKCADEYINYYLEILGIEHETDAK